MIISNNTKKLISKLLIFVISFQSLSFPVLVSAQADTFQYDANGNLLKDEADNCYEYNEANKPQYIGPDCYPPNNGYWYDHTGRRIKEVNSSETIYYTGKHEHYTKTSGITWTGDTNYYYANGHLVAKKNDDGTYTYYHNDHLGSPNLQTDESGDVLERAEFSPFGRPEPSRTYASLDYNNKIQFTGQKEDRTGLNYYGARYYSSTLRHFTQPDPMLPDPYDPQQLNRYAYVRNNPVKYVDPSGNQIALGFGIAAAEFLKYLGVTAMMSGILLPGTATLYGGVVGYQECQTVDCNNTAEYVLQGAQYGAEESFLPAAALYTGGAFSYSIGSYAASNLQSNSLNKQFKDLSNYRNSQSLPAAGTKSDAYTTAKLEVNGEAFYAKNGLELDPSFKVNAISKGHAEIQALEKAHRAGTQLNGASATIYVDRDPCTACGQNAGIASYVNSLGLNDLTIHSPNQTTIIGPQ